MREIKFRAYLWSNKHTNDQWVDYSMGIIGFWENFTNWMAHKEIMQFTGLLDKQGKEIYEGDITEKMSWIGWCEKCCSFTLFLVDFGCSSCSGDEYWHDTISAKLEVIGNIYEHSYLLDGGSK